MEVLAGLIHRICERRITQTPPGTNEYPWITSGGVSVPQRLRINYDRTLAKVYTMCYNTDMMRDMIFSRTVRTIRTKSRHYGRNTPSTDHVIPKAERVGMILQSKINYDCPLGKLCVMVGFAKL